jgi:hypothetical protein
VTVGTVQLQSQPESDEVGVIRTKFTEETAAQLEDVVKSIDSFDNWKHLEKIKFFGCFLHRHLGQERFSGADILACYDAVYLDPPTNMSPYLKSLQQQKPKDLIYDGWMSYYLPKHVRDSFEAKYAKRADRPIRRTEPILPLSVVEGTRDYLVRIVQQTNGCYERQWFDACSVMIRKLVEILIIEVYEANKRSDALKDQNGNFRMLGDLIGTILKDTALNLGRETKRSLPDIKTLGDRAAHNRLYLAKKEDVDRVRDGLRVTVDELLHLANLK